MASAFPSEATVALTPLQQWTSLDAIDMATIPQATTDNVVAAFLAAGQAYKGLAVTANQDALGVTVGTGILYNLGGGYPLRAPFKIDLSPQINAIPDAVQSQIVLIVGNGGTATVQESRTLEDASLKPSNPADLWPTVQQVVTTRNVRAVTPSIVPGTPAATNVQAPAYNPLLCLLATVTLNKTGVISVVQSTAAQIVGLDKLAPIVAAQGLQLASYQSTIDGLKSSVSALTLALSILKKQVADGLAALQASQNAQASQQAAAQQPGTTVLNITDFFNDATGLTVAANPVYAVGSGLTFPQLVTNPIGYFPLAQYASNLKTFSNGRYLTPPYTEVKDGGNALNNPRNSGGVYVYATNLGPLSVTPQMEGFAVQRTRYGAAYAAQSAPALAASGNPSQLFGSASYPIAYDQAWTNWANYSPELSHAVGLWRDLAARGYWGPRAAGVAIGNLPAVSEVFQVDTDDMELSFQFFHAGSPKTMRMLFCEELNGAPDFNNVLMDVSGTPATDGTARMLFTHPYPLLKRAARRYHRVFVFTDPNPSVFVTTTADNTPDPAMKGLLYRTANGGWAQDQNNQHITCTYTRANFTAGTPIELRTLDMGGNGVIDNLDILTPALVPTGCDVYYGTYKADGTYARLGQINPADASTNVLAGRPSSLRFAVELVPTGRTAPVIDMAPTTIGATTAVPGRRAGTLTAQSALRSAKDANGNPVLFTQITQTVTLQNFNAALQQTYTEQLATGANLATLTNPTTSSGPTAQPDGTVQFTFTWKLAQGVPAFVTTYNGFTPDVTQTFTMPKAITTAAP